MSEQKIENLEISGADVQDGLMLVSHHDERGGFRRISVDEALSQEAAADVAPTSGLLGDAVMVDNAPQLLAVRMANLAAAPRVAGTVSNGAAPVAPADGNPGGAVIPTGATAWFNLSDVAPRNEEWRIKIENESFHFVRYVNGKPQESYRHVGPVVAVMWAVAIIQGFEPSLRLSSSDRPAG